MENLFVPFLNDCTVECLIMLIQENPYLSSLFVSHCDFASIIEFLEIIFPSIPKIPATLVLRNIISSILKRYGTSSTNLDLEFALQDLRTSTDPVVQNLLPFLTGQREFRKTDETSCHHTAFYLFMFIDSYPGLAAVMTKSIQALRARIGDETLLSILGPDFLYLYNECPPLELIRRADLDFSDLQMLFKAHQIYIFPDLGKTLQQRASQVYQFPSIVPGDGDGLVLSLIHSSMTGSTHFLDILSQGIVENLTTGEFEVIHEIMRGFEHMTPFLLCAHDQLLLADLNGCTALLEHSYPPSIASGCLRRFRNDAMLSEMMTKMTHVDVCFADLQYASIPKTLESVIGNPEILSFASRKYFSFSEADANKDFDFIRGYHVLMLFLRMLSANPTKTRNYLNEISKLLSSVSDTDTRRKLVVDVFSLLFLQKDNHFVVTSWIARQTLLMLDRFNLCPGVKPGLDIVNERVDYEALFKRDPKEVFKAIQSRNWALADRLTLSLPVYRNLFLLAISIFTVLESKQIPEEAAELLDVINLELLFSQCASEKQKSSDDREDGHLTFLSQIKDFISVSGENVVMPQDFPYVPFIQKSSKELKSTIRSLSETLGISNQDFLGLAQKREKIHGDSIFQVFPHYVEWQSLTELVQMFESDFLYFMSSWQIESMDFSVSKSLKGFLQYLDLYYKSAMLASGGDEDIIFRRYDLRLVIAKIFNLGSIEKARQWCEMGHVSLFDYVLGHLVDFDISQPFIDMYEKEHPLEILCLCETIPDLSTTQKSIFTKKHKQVQKSDFNESQEIEDLIDQAMQGSLGSDVDDKVFRVNPKRLYSRILERVQGPLSDGLYQLLELVDYVSPEEDQDKLKWMKLTRNLKATEPRAVLLVLIQNKEFEKLYEFVDGKKMLMKEAFRLLLEMNLNIEEFLYRFPSFVRIAVKEFRFDSSLIDVVARFMGPQLRHYIASTRYLPDVVKNSCNTLNIDEVKKVFIAKPILLEYVDKRAKGVLTDDVISDILDGIDSFIVHSRLYRVVVSRLGCDVQKLFEAWQARATTFVKSLEVNSCRTERIALRTFNEMMSNMQGDDYRQIEFLRDFVTLELFSSFDISYNFSAFGDAPRLGEYLLRLLFKCDADISLVDRCKTVFGVQLHNYYLNRCAQMLRLGFLNDAKSYFEQKRKELPDLYIDDLSLYTDGDSAFIDIVEKQKFFDAEQIVKITYPEPAITSYATIPYISDLVSGKRPLSKAKYERRFYVTRGARAETAVSLLMLRGDWEIAYQLMMGLQDPQIQSNVFVHKFYYPMICCNALPQLHDFMLSQDPDLAVMSRLITKLIQFMKSHELFHGLYNIARMANRFDEAAEAAIGLFSSAETNDKRVMYCGWADFYLQQGILYRSTRDVCRPRYVSSDETKSELERTKQVVGFQLAFLRICISKNIEFDSSFDLLHDSSAFANVGAYFFLTSDSERAYEMIQADLVSLKNVVSQLARVLTTVKEANVLSFVEEYRVKDQSLLGLVMPKLLPLLAMERRSDLILNIIPIASDEMSTQCGLFYEFDFLYEALSMYVEDRSIIPLVAHRAAELGIELLVEQCLALLRH